MVEERKLEIIKQLAEQKTIETLIYNITKKKSFELDDLAQDIYLYLINYDSEKIVELSKDKQIIYFIVRIIYNNYFSVTSRYYYTYKKYLNNTTTLEDLYDKI